MKKQIIVLVEIEINDEWEESYLSHTISTIQLHLKYAIEATIIAKPNDPVRYVSSYLAEKADYDYQANRREEEHEEVDKQTPWWKFLDCNSLGNADQIKRVTVAYTNNTVVAARVC